MKSIAGAGLASLLGLVICVIPVIAGAWFVFRPGERLLSIMRPLSLAAIFAAVCDLVLAFTNGFHALGQVTALDPDAIRRLAFGMAEGMAPAVISFALLAVSWLLVAIGMRRNS